MMTTSIQMYLPNFEPDDYDWKDFLDYNEVNEVLRGLRDTGNAYGAT